MLEQIVKGICESAGAMYEFQFTRGYASVINDQALTDNGRRLIQRTFGKPAVLEIDPLMPGEDFSAFLDFCPGFFVELGARNEKEGCIVPHHNSKYLMDEAALRYGVEYLYKLVQDRLS